MIVLGLDTSTSSSAAAVRLADGRTLRARDDPAAGEHPGHATRLLGMSAGLLEQAGVGWRDLELIAVGVGPGTFTGLRVGVATARGLAQSLGIALVGVSSLRALAAAALAQTSAQAALAAIDARRGEVFAAAYGRAGGDGGQPVELTVPQALAPEALGALVAAASERGAPAPAGWLAFGDGAVRYREELLAAAIDTAPDGSPLNLLDAGVLCELAAAAPAAGSEQVLPDYRRRPDAELSLRPDALASGAAR